MDGEYFASINEVSKRLDVPAHTLRYWEKQFPVAIRPTTGAGGRRYYRPETVQRLVIIKELLYNRGMTIAGVKKMMREGDFPSTADAAIPAPRPTQSPRPVRSVPADDEIIPVSVGTAVTDAEIDALIRTLTAARDILTAA